MHLPIPDQYSRLIQRALTFFLVLFTCMLLLNHALIYFRLNLVYIDSDQPFMWIGAADYARGYFAEPRFYGQDYNTFMEALVAVPFIWCGMPVYCAVPLATHLIFLFPLLFTVFYLYRQGFKGHAVCILALFSCLSTDFDIVTAIPRGFITGLFFTAGYVVSILHPKRLLFIGINTAMAVLANAVNPNTLLVSVPFLFYIFLLNYRNVKYYAVSAAGLCMQIPVYLFLDRFYDLHPDYITHGLLMEFGMKWFSESMSEPLIGFLHLSPFSRATTLFWPVMFVVFIILLYRFNRRACAAFMLVVLIYMSAQFSSKMRDAHHWAFYSFSRMYLAIPFVFALFSLFIPVRATRIFVAIIAGCFAMSVVKITQTDRVIAYQTDKKEVEWLGVHLVRLDEARHAIEFYGDVCRKHQAPQFIISNLFWLNTFLGYGGPAFHKDYPATMETRNEKRAYVRSAGDTIRAERLIFLAENSNVDTLLRDQPFSLKRLDQYGLFLVTENKLTNNEFARATLKAEIKMRKLQGRDFY